MQSSLLGALLLAATSTACVVEPPADAAAPPSDAVLDRIVFTPDELAPLDPDLDDAPAVCGCETQACVVDWIEEHVGCDLCAHVTCDSGMVGACVPCVDPA